MNMEMQSIGPQRDADLGLRLLPLRQLLGR